MLHHKPGTDLRIVRTSSTGELEAGYPIVIPDIFVGENWFFGGLRPLKDGWGLVWVDHFFPASHAVKLALLTPSFGIAAGPRTLLTGPIYRALYFAPPNGSQTLLVPDPDGLHVFRLGTADLEDLLTLEDVGARMPEVRRYC